jgi:hypothetical protein
LDAALVGVSVPVGKRDGSKVTHVLLGVLVQRSLAADKGGADFRVHLRVAKNHGQIVPGRLVDVHGLIDDDTFDARQLDCSAADELLETVDATEDNIGVGQEHVLVTGVSEVDSGSGQLDAGVVGEDDAIHPDSGIHVLVADEHKLVGTSEDAILHFLFGDGDGVVSAFLNGQRSADLHDNGGHAARSGHEVGWNDSEHLALLQSFDHVQLLNPKIGDSQGLKGTSNTVVDCTIPFQGRLGRLSAVMAAWEALVQSGNGQPVFEGVFRSSHLSECTPRSKR